MIASASTQVTSGSYTSTNAPTGIFEVSNGTSGLFNVLSSGNVGIGTTSPTKLLSVGGSNQFTVDSNGTVTATSFVKSGGTSSQFLKADGSIDSNAYDLSGAATTAVNNLQIGGVNILDGTQTLNNSI
jgi:hypothetical protein